MTTLSQRFAELRDLAPDDALDDFDIPDIEAAIYELADVLKIFPPVLAFDLDRTIDEIFASSLLV